MCVQTDQLKDLMGPHRTSGRAENNGVVFLLFLIRPALISSEHVTGSASVSGHPRLLLLLLLCIFLKLLFSGNPLKNMFLS